MVYGALEEEMVILNMIISIQFQNLSIKNVRPLTFLSFLQKTIHALTLKTLTPAQWEEKQLQTAL